MPRVWNYGSPQFLLHNSLLAYREERIAEIQLIRQPMKIKIIKYPGCRETVKLQLPFQYLYKMQLL